MNSQIFCVGRCMLHGFNLVTCSVFGSKTANDVLKKAQCIVTVTRRTTMMQAHVKALAALNGIKVGLHSAGTTRFSSQYECLNSVALHQNVFQQLVSDEDKRKFIPRATATQPDLESIINDYDFWQLLRHVKEFMLTFQKACLATCLVSYMPLIM